MSSNQLGSNNPFPLYDFSRQFQKRFNIKEKGKEKETIPPPPLAPPVVKNTASISKNISKVKESPHKFGKINIQSKGNENIINEIVKDLKKYQKPIKKVSHSSIQSSKQSLPSIPSTRKKGKNRKITHSSTTPSSIKNYNKYVLSRFKNKTNHSFPKKKEQKQEPKVEKSIIIQDDGAFPSMANIPDEIVNIQQDPNKDKSEIDNEMSSFVDDLEIDSMNKTKSFPLEQSSLSPSNTLSSSRSTSSSYLFDDEGVKPSMINYESEKEAHDIDSIDEEIEDSTSVTMTDSDDSNSELNDHIDIIIDSTNSINDNQSNNLNCNGKSKKIKEKLNTLKEEIKELLEYLNN